MKCHNCNTSRSFQNVLKDLDPLLYREFLVEKFRDEGREPTKKPVLDFRTIQVPRKELLGLPSIASLVPEHYARRYVEGRQIPSQFLQDLYLTEDFQATASGITHDPEIVRKLRKGEWRLVIPFYDQQKNLIVIQGRAFNDDALRYITIKVTADAPKIYGLDRYDIRKPGFVLEGPLDSTFLTNAIASADGDFEAVGKYVNKNNTTFVIDNQPRNPDVVNNALKMVALGYRVCVWPDNVHEKDINAMVLAGRTPKAVEEIINNSSFVGILANLKINQWKRC